MARTRGAPQASNRLVDNDDLFEAHPDRRWEIGREAERVFFDEGVAQGALLPGGLDWLRPAGRRPYYLKAMENLGLPTP